MAPRPAVEGPGGGHGFEPNSFLHLPNNSESLLYHRIPLGTPSRPVQGARVKQGCHPIRPDGAHGLLQGGLMHQPQPVRAYSVTGNPYLVFARQADMGPSETQGRGEPIDFSGHRCRYGSVVLHPASGVQRRKPTFNDS